MSLDRAARIAAFANDLGFIIFFVIGAIHLARLGTWLGSMAAAAAAVIQAAAILWRLRRPGPRPLVLSRASETACSAIMALAGGTAVALLLGLGPASPVDLLLLVAGAAILAANLVSLAHLLARRRSRTA